MPGTESPDRKTDALEPVGQPEAASIDDSETLGRHIVVEPHENLCLLRSGQDWSVTGDAERKFYFEHVKPFLDIGMKEIRDEGRASRLLLQSLYAFGRPQRSARKHTA